MKWPLAKLGDICSVITKGTTPNTLRRNYTSKGIPFLRAENLQNGEVVLNGDTLFINEETDELLSRSRIQTGDVLLSIAGTIGRVAIVSSGLPKMNCNQAVAIIRIAESLNGRFLLYWLQSSSALAQILGAKVTATISNLSLGQIKQLRIPIPPLAVQDQIVKLLDKADELRKLRTQADFRTAEFIPALFHEMFSSANFPPKFLGEIAEVVSGVAKGRKFNAQESVNVPYVRVANVQDGYLNLSELKNIEALPREVEELTLKKGDVLMTEGGDFNKLGRGAMLERDLPNCIHQNHVFRVRCNKQTLLPQFFAKFLLTQTARHYFLRCAKKTSNLASINMTQLRALPVPVPPMSLQKEFAQRVTEIRELEAGQAASRRRLEELFQSLLHRAFNGEL